MENEGLKVELKSMFEQIFKTKGISFNLDDVVVIDSTDTYQKFELRNKDDKSLIIKVGLKLDENGEVEGEDYELFHKGNKVLSGDNFSKFTDNLKNYILENSNISDESFNELGKTMLEGIVGVHKELVGYNTEGEVYFNEEKSSKDEFKLVYDVKVKGSKLGLKCELVVILNVKTMQVNGLITYLVNDEGLSKEVKNYENLWVEAESELENEIPLNADELKELRIQKLEEWLTKHSGIMGHEITWDGIKFLENSPNKAIYDIIFENGYGIDLSVTVEVKYLSSKVDVYDNNVKVIIENKHGIFKEQVNFESMFGIIKDLKGYELRKLEKFDKEIKSNSGALSDITVRYLNSDDNNELTMYKPKTLKFVVDIPKSKNNLKILYNLGIRLSKHDDRVLVESEEYIVTDDKLTFKEDVTLNGVWNKIYELEPGLKGIESQLITERLEAVTDLISGYLDEDIPEFSDVYSFEEGADIDTYQFDFPSGTFKDGLNLSISLDVEFKKDSAEFKSKESPIIHNGGDEGFDEVEVEFRGLSDKLFQYLEVDKEKLIKNRLEVMREWFTDKTTNKHTSVDVPSFSDIYSFNEGTDNDTYQIDFPEGTFKKGLHLSVSVDVEFKENSVQLIDIKPVIIHNGGEGDFDEVEVEPIRLALELVKYLKTDEEKLIELRLERMRQYFDKFVGGSIPQYDDIYSFNEGDDEDTYQIDFPDGTFKNGLHLSVSFDVLFEEGTAKISKAGLISIHNGGEGDYTEKTIRGDKPDKIDKVKKELEHWLEPHLEDGEFLTIEEIERLKKGLVAFHKKIPVYIDGYEFEYSVSEDLEDEKYIVFDTVVSDAPGDLRILNTIYLNENNKVKEIDLYLMYEKEDGELIEKNLNDKNCWKEVKKLLRQSGVLSESQIKSYTNYINKFHQQLPNFIEGNVAEYTDFEGNKVSFSTYVNNSDVGLSVISTITIDMTGGGVKKVDLYLLDDTGEVDESVSKDKCWGRILEIEPKVKGGLSQEDIKKYEKLLTSWHSKLPGYIVGNEVEYNRLEKNVAYFDTFVKGSEKGICIITSTTLDSDGKFKKIELYLVDDEMLDEPVSKDKCWKKVRLEEPGIEDKVNGIDENKEQVLRQFKVIINENSSKTGIKKVKRLEDVYKAVGITHKHERTSEYGDVINVKIYKNELYISPGIIFDKTLNKVVIKKDAEVDIEEMTAVLVEYLKELTKDSKEKDKDKLIKFIGLTYQDSIDLRKKQYSEDDIKNIYQSIFGSK